MTEMEQDEASFEKARLEITIEELRTRVAELELCNKNANALIADQADESQRIVDKLQSRLSTLEKENEELRKKASEGMEKALAECAKCWWGI